jgi:hypothetical protein
MEQSINYTQPRSRIGLRISHDVEHGEGGMRAYERKERNGDWMDYPSIGDFCPVDLDEWGDREIRVETVNEPFDYSKVILST